MSRANTRRIDQAEVKLRRARTRKKIVLFSGTMLALAFTISALLLLNQAFRISTWEIETTGKSHGNLERQIDAAMKALPDYDFWSTRPGLLRTQLLEILPDLEDIRIQRMLTGSLHLHGIARTPVGVWQNEDGEIYMVDIHGTAYRPLQASEMADLPILRIRKADIGKACELLQTLQSAQPVHFSQISELLANSSSWKINFDQGQQWMISRHENISYSVSRVSDLLAKPRWRSGHWRVDARTDARWFIRPAGQEGVI